MSETNNAGGSEMAKEQGDRRLGAKSGGADKSGKKLENILKTILNDVLGAKVEVVTIPIENPAKDEELKREIGAINNMLSDKIVLLSESIADELVSFAEGIALVIQNQTEAVRSLGERVNELARQRAKLQAALESSTVKIRSLEGQLRSSESVSNVRQQQVDGMVKQIQAYRNAASVIANDLKLHVDDIKMNKKAVGLIRSRAIETLLKLSNGIDPSRIDTPEKYAEEVTGG